MIYSAPLPYVLDAAAYYAAIADLPWAVWLDSAGLGRYDILCAGPVVTLTSLCGEIAICDAEGKRTSSEEPFTLLRQQLGRHTGAEPNIPFAGGAVGYWGYGLAQSMKLPVRMQEENILPDMAVAIYDWAIVLDHQQKTAQLVSQQRYPATEEVLPQILARLKSEPDKPGERYGMDQSNEKFKVHGKIQSNFTKESYTAAFGQVQSYLWAGDCYQINLAQRFSAAATGDSLTAYLTLRKLSPAPYSAFLNLPHGQILCASPERFLNIQNGTVETRPIKGTRPRSSDKQIDSQLAAELQSHPKDRAENLMIVDLLRNDLGKCCTPGTIRVPGLFEVESFASLHHLVSTVEGKLANGQDALDILRACFPGGSVTGAPKKRAMQIIEQIEPSSRGVYCGVIGYIGFDGNMDSNIVIRTLVYTGGNIRCWAGGGIVADSNAEAEYQESMDKAGAMLELLRQYGGN
ncbi:MAG: aminodeoxychorismate synthase component I [Nitrosomonadales bacterium]